MNDNEQIGPVPQPAPPQSPLQPVNNIPEETSVNTMPLETPPDAPPPFIPQDTPTPTVIIPASSSPDVSKWFYFVFAITLLLFVGVTTLLVLSLFQKKSSGVPVPNQQITPTITAPTPTENPRSKSDELDDIEADIALIDFSELGKKITDLENQATVSASL